MEFSVASRLENSTIIAEVIAPEADENTQYAYYLYETQMGILEKRRYTTETSCSFQLTSPGYYYVKVFVRSWPDGKQGEYVQTSQKTKPVMLYPTKPVLYSQLEEEDFCSVDGTIYDILWDGVHFEFFIHYKPDSAQAVILGTGDVGQHPRPYFSRISWAKELPYTTIYYTDPTSYMPPCTLGWGYGTNDRWYLENIAVLLYQILMSAALYDTASLQNKNLIRMLNGFEPVGNHNNRFIMRQRFNRFLKFSFIFRINVGGSLIQNDDRGIFQHGACDG